MKSFLLAESNTSMIFQLSRFLVTPVLYSKPEPYAEQYLKITDLKFINFFKAKHPPSPDTSQGVSTSSIKKRSSRDTEKRFVKK